MSEDTETDDDSEARETSSTMHDSRLEAAPETVRVTHTDSLASGDEGPDEPTESDWTPSDELISEIPTTELPLLLDRESATDGRAQRKFALRPEVRKQETELYQAVDTQLRDSVLMADFREAVYQVGLCAKPQVIELLKLMGYDTQAVELFVEKLASEGVIDDIPEGVRSRDTTRGQRGSPVEESQQ
jgi:hypothetical protein